jgi:hypothetical protein
MALNLEKKKITEDYYYSENGITVGPFPVSELITKITPDTLVYKEGISWTVAKKIPEISKHLKKTEVKIEEKNKTKKNKTLFVILIVSLLVVFSVFLFLKSNDNKEEVMTNKSLMDTINDLKNVSSTVVKLDQSINKEDIIQTENDVNSISEQNNENIKDDKQNSNVSNRNLIFSNFNELNSETERHNYFNNKLYPKRETIKKIGGKDLEKYKEIVKKSYSDLLILFNETTDQNKLNELCNLRQDIEDELKDLNCEINKEIQKKLKEICF